MKPNNVPPPSLAGRILSPKVLGRVGLALLAAQLCAQTREQLPDGVEHYSYPATGGGDSYLNKLFSQMYNVIFTPKSVRPFGRSIAFLAGVPQYRSLTPQLPSVHNDLAQVRDFLLNDAHFDEVYVAEGDVVTRDLIEGYMKGVLPSKMQRTDRLLFYYSGHGGDNHGGTGYMLFSKADKGKFWGNDVLPVDLLKDWSQELPVQHVLFILDSCSSGLGIIPKGNQDAQVLLLQTLSGNGSRTVLTAGTASEETYAEDARGRIGNSFFTKAFLNAFKSRSVSDEKDGFITVTDLFAGIETEMAKFRAEYGKATTPRLATLQEQDYRGTFVFLNPRTTAATLSDEQAKAMGVRVVSKGEATDAAITEFGAGIIEVHAENGGSLTLDDADSGYIAANETRQFLRQRVGKHRLELKGVVPEVKEVSVDSGGIGYAYFGLKSPIDTSGKIPVGSLVVQSTHDLSGDVSLDSVDVGRVEKNGYLRLDNIIAGVHHYRIVGQTQSEAKPVEIVAGRVTYVVVAPPNPPTNLTVTVQ